MEPDAVEPDELQPDEVEPDATEVEPDVHEAELPDAVELDEVEPDAVEPDAVEPGAIEPDATGPEVPDAVEAALPDEVDPDEIEPDAVEAALPDEVDPDAIEPDAVEAELPDAVERDAASQPTVSASVKGQGTAGLGAEYVAALDLAVPTATDIVHEAEAVEVSGATDPPVTAETAPAGDGPPGPSDVPWHEAVEHGADAGLDESTGGGLGDAIGAAAEASEVKRPAPTREAAGRDTTRRASDATPSAGPVGAPAAARSAADSGGSGPIRTTTAPRVDVTRSTEAVTADIRSRAKTGCGPAAHVAAQSGFWPTPSPHRRALTVADQASKEERPGGVPASPSAPAAPTPPTYASSSPTSGSGSAHDASLSATCVATPPQWSVRLALDPLARDPLNSIEPLPLPG